MKKPSEKEPDWENQREKIIGLGESSIRKSYYPELQQKHAELLKKNEELSAAYEELTATEEELRQNYDELSRNEQELRESEEFLSSIVENIPDMIFVKDVKELRFVRFNKAGEALLGYSRQDLLGKNDYDLFPKSEADFFTKKDREVLVNKKPVDIPEEKIQTRYMGRRILHTKKIPILSRDKKITYLLGISEDITERRQSEKALQESFAILKGVIESPRDVVIFALDRQYRYIAFNENHRRTMKQIWGVDIALGTSMPEYISISEDRQKAIINFDRALSGESFTLSEAYGNTALERRWYENTYNPITDEKGTIIGLTLFLTDITERKRAEEERRAAREYTEKLISTANAMIVGLDNRGNITVFNKAAEDITGYSRDDLAGRNWFEVIVPRDRYPRVWEEFPRIMAGDLPVDFETPLLTKSGEERYIVWKNTEICEGEVITGTISFGIDITGRMRAEKALQLARHKLTLLNAVTFKDIQTAVFSLTAYLELMKTVVTDEKGRSFLEKQVSANQKILDSLNFAKNYQDMGIQNPRWQDVNQVFLFAISHLDFLKIRHTFQVEGLQIYADPLLEKVLFHLMQNVLRHGVHATEVTVWCKEKPDGLILIIEDNGVGIPAEEKHMIFDRGHGKHTGLGLFLVREVLSITGMTIKETGEPGKGARFEIAVPTGNYRFDKKT